MKERAAILIVDDDGDVRQAASLALASAARVEMAATPDAMLPLLVPGRFECVLLDMNFALGERSGRPGIDALAAAKTADPTVSVVLMTGFGAVSLAVESLKRGADDFVLKPWRNEALVAAVTAAAAQCRTRRAGTTLDVMEQAAIAAMLSRHGGNIAQAAAALGLSRPALYRRMHKYGL